MLHRQWRMGGEVCKKGPLGVRIRDHMTNFFIGHNVVLERFQLVTRLVGIRAGSFEAPQSPDKGARKEALPLTAGS